MRLASALYTAILIGIGTVAGCSDDTGVPGDGSISGEQAIDSGGDGANPCAHGICTPPGGGDMFVPPDGGMPDLTWICKSYPAECGTDEKCLIDKLCGNVDGQVNIASCTYSCYWP